MTAESLPQTQLQFVTSLEQARNINTNSESVVVQQWSGRIIEILEDGAFNIECSVAYGEGRTLNPAETDRFETTLRPDVTAQWQAEAQRGNAISVVFLKAADEATTAIADVHMAINLFESRVATPNKVDAAKRAAAQRRLGRQAM